MSLLTKFLSRLLGSFLVLVALTMLVHKEASIEMIKRMMGHAGAPFAIGMIAVAVGLAMILGHNIWSGSALTIVVTVVGWCILIKGLFCLFLPVGLIYTWMTGPLLDQYFYVAPAISLPLGLYLLIAGSMAKADSATAK
jgi:hypothetical protein